MEYVVPFWIGQDDAQPSEKLTAVERFPKLPGGQGTHVQGGRGPVEAPNPSKLPGGHGLQDPDTESVACPGTPHCHAVASTSEKRD